MLMKHDLSCPCSGTVGGPPGYDFCTCDSAPVDRRADLSDLRIATPKKEDAVVLNGHEITRQDVRSYLKSKRVSLWSDWCITHPDRMELAIDWFLDEMGELSASVAA